MNIDRFDWQSNLDTTSHNLQVSIVTRLGETTRSYSIKMMQRGAMMEQELKYF
jgi:hypothetical protein